MKKLALIMMLTLTFLITGCASKIVDTNEKTENKLNEKLISYGKLVYENNIKGYINYSDGMYVQTITLDQLKTYGYDISEFKNETTLVECNILETKIEIKIPFDKDGNESEEVEYNPILFCE